LNKHLNGKGEDSYSNHKRCSFCGTYHDDYDCLKRHYRDEHRICEFCQIKKKKDTDFVFADYRAFMNHAKQFHHICGMGGCDCVFKDLTSLDLHQAEIHKKKLTLRIGKRDDKAEEEEEEKKPTVTADQYKRMNKDVSHFPTLETNTRSYVPTSEAQNKNKNNQRNTTNNLGSR
jgi:hypothetical protein